MNGLICPGTVLGTQRILQSFSGGPVLRELLSRNGVVVGGMAKAGLGKGRFTYGQ